MMHDSKNIEIANIDENVDNFDFGKISDDASNNIIKRIKNKAVRLFTYIEKILSLNESIDRDFRTTINTDFAPLWLANLPAEAENLRLQSFETEETFDGSSHEMEACLTVEKKAIDPAPKLPKILDEWIGQVTPMQVPAPKIKIAREVKFNEDNSREIKFNKYKKEYKQGASIPPLLNGWVVITPGQLPIKIQANYVDDYWSNHDELQRLLEGYIENEWKPWSNKVRGIYAANALYDQLFALRQLLNNEGDNYELLLGHGLLTWRHENVGDIYSPIFMTPLVIDFDASKGIIEILPDQLYRGFVEISSLYEMESLNEFDLDKWASKINEKPFDFWHLESLKLQSKTLVNYLASNSEDSFVKGMIAEPQITEVPTICNAPVIFCRKRTNSAWSKYTEAVRRDIDASVEEPTDFIKDLIGEYDQSPNSSQQTNFDFDTDKAEICEIKDGELLFPLPWNDEQKRIAEQAELSYGVVVKGPPGTGKTHTIANLISRFLSQGKSVLVTAQTSKPLNVLRDKLPENIRSLAVSQLQCAVGKDSILQQSISEISSNLGERHTKFSEERVNNIRKELKTVRETKASLANRLRMSILADSTETISIDGDNYKPIDAAKLISSHSNNEALSWHLDNINFCCEINFDSNDVNMVSALLVGLKSAERELYKFKIPDVSTLPSKDDAIKMFTNYHELICASKYWDDTFGPDGLDIEYNELSELLERLKSAKEVLDLVCDEHQINIFNNCIASQHEREKWNIVIERIKEKIKIIGNNKNDLLGHIISGETSLALPDLFDAVGSLLNKATKKGKIGPMDKLLLSSNSRKVLASYKVDDRSPDNLERITLLHKKTIVEKTEKEINLLLKQAFDSIGAHPNIEDIFKDCISLEAAISFLVKITSYYTEHKSIDVFLSKHKKLSKYVFTSLTDVTELIKSLSSLFLKMKMNNVECILSEWNKSLSNIGMDAHEVVDGLQKSILTRDINNWCVAFDKIGFLLDKQSESLRLKLLSDKICKFAPLFYTNIIKTIDRGDHYTCPHELRLKWAVTRLKSWLNHIHNSIDIDASQSELERLAKRELDLNSELISVLSWQRQIDKVTKQQRDALMAWACAMKKYGKGTGKYAKKWLREAQDALKEAILAVPVWIMPMARAAQMFSDPRAGMFDVVIFDEASQCDIRGLTISYLGKKILIVGDPDQISPAGIFQDQEKSFDLASRYLFDIPYKNNFSITSSLFDLAKVRIPTIIQLNEHFRCVPEIIAFSNHYIYESKLRPLRYPHPKGLLRPSLVPIYVEKGYQNTNNKINEPEAQAIVEKLVECLEDPNYQTRPDGKPCTFGIISLLAVDQAKYIKSLILKHPKIGEKVIEERQISCGDAYDFQGDERSVIFLSMVKALDFDKQNDTVRALTDENTKQRFNVAVTRARDQVFLYHSIPLGEFKNQQDWRYRLLNWFYDPMTEELKAGRDALKKQFDCGRASHFSLDVGNLILDRGYKVIAEYEVIGRRIDLVVQGENARLAVECDGDQYHTIENFDEDYSREQQLRRAGWEFWRVTGSSFYRYKEKALESLWKKLAELGIEPVVG